VALPPELAPALRAGDPPVAARLHEGMCLLDVLTLSEQDLAALPAAVAAARATLAR
jgi:L-seryl-tRNA(Ser) seleniumtransferase